jgi:hypothetical protein
MIGRRQINARRRAPRLRSLGARFGERLGDVAMAVEERVGWPLADGARAVLEVVRWPLERAKWTAERRVVWPLGERAAGRGISGSSLAVGAALVATCGVAAVAIVAGGRSGGEASNVAEVPTSAAAERSAPSAAEPSAPVLHGAAPDFTPEGGDAVAKVANRDTVIASKPDTGAPASSSSSSSSSSSAVATPSSADRNAVDPGPAAIEVARRFSGAFVLYETGDDGAKVRAAFDATASPRLTQALLRRPPRLPANVKVPKAKVLNVVPGPRHGNTFTLSASLLRVGVTSELRIDVQRDDQSGQWQVTDVLG